MGMSKVTKAYFLPARRVIHTVGPKYAVKYHTAAENALSHCYRSCLELLLESGLLRKWASKVILWPYMMFSTQKLNITLVNRPPMCYRGGVESEGRPVMVVVGAHFLLRCLDLERFVFYIVKEFEPLIQKPSYIV